MVYDIAIIGAGPGGSTLARLLAPRYKVLLVDKRHLDRQLEQATLTKCCGGLIAPDAQKVLAELGLGLPEHVLVGPQLFAVRTIDLLENIERFYQRFYINIDREKFDRWLVSLIPENVDTVFGTVYKGYETDGETYRLHFLHNGTKQYEAARVVIGADGANSLLRRQAFPGKALPKKYIAIQEWLEVEKALPYFTALFDSSITDFYAWTIPKHNCLLLGAALEIEDNPYDKFEQLKERLIPYGLCLGRGIRREGAFIHRPQCLSQVYTGAEGIALIGEAAGFISPSSAEGFSYAMRSAMLLAESINTGIDGFPDRYYHRTRMLRFNIRYKHLKSHGMYWPWLRNLVMRIGIASVRVRAQ